MCSEGCCINKMYLLTYSHAFTYLFTCLQQSGCVGDVNTFSNHKIIWLFLVEGRLKTIIILLLLQRQPVLIRQSNQTTKLRGWLLRDPSYCFLQIFFHWSTYCVWLLLMVLKAWQYLLHLSAWHSEPSITLLRLHLFLAAEDPFIHPQL